jgi:HEAT repeat protein
LEPLIEALDDKYWNVKQAAAKALGDLGDKRAIRPLVRALGEDQFAFTRLAAASALSKLGEKKWESIIKGDGEDYKRLGNSGDSRALEPLVKALKDKDHNVRIKAAKALGNLGCKRAIDHLHAAFENNTDKNVQTAIVNAVKKIQGEI